MNIDNILVLKNTVHWSWIFTFMFSLILILTSGSMIHPYIHPSMLLVPSKLSQNAYSLLRSANFGQTLRVCFCGSVVSWLLWQRRTHNHYSHFLETTLCFGPFWYRWYVLFGIYHFFFCIVEELFINNHFINGQAYGCMDDLMDVLKITFELLTFTTHLSASFIHS